MQCFRLGGGRYSEYLGELQFDDREKGMQLHIDLIMACVLFRMNMKYLVILDRVAPERTINLILKDLKVKEYIKKVIFVSLKR